MNTESSPGSGSETGQGYHQATTEEGQAKYTSADGAKPRKRRPKRKRPAAPLMWSRIHLAGRHQDKLQSSGIPLSVAAARGYRTMYDGSDIELAKLGFHHVPDPALLIPLWWNGEKVLHQIRPDSPRTNSDGSTAKYITPTGARLRLDCPPQMQQELNDPETPLLITEGALKADAAAGVGLPCISVTGVDCWQQGGRPLPDWDDVPLSGRAVYVVYDSDVMFKEEVEAALDALTDFLQERGAEVWWVILPQVGKDKVGLDDYLAQDHSAEELLALARVPEEVSDAQLRRRVRKELRRRRVVELADAKEAAADWEPPPSWSLAEAEQMTWPELTYPLADLHPEGSNVLLAAQYKAGKTTLALSIISALLDGEPFLGRFPVGDGPHRVAWLNCELTQLQAFEWLEARGIRSTDPVFVMHLREHRLPVRARHVERWLVDWLVERKITYLIVDPFAKVFDGASENDNTDVRRWLSALDEVKRKAGVSNLVLAVHTGRAEMAEGQEHARGATALDDWADVRWIMTEERDSRFLAAHGRDVAVDEFELGYDEAKRTYTAVDGNRNRAKARLQARVNQVLEAVNAEPGITSSGLEDALSGSKGRKTEAIKEARRQGLIDVQDEGLGKAKRWFPAGARKLPREAEKP